jgi:hypothetical protein
VVRVSTEATASGGITMCLIEISPNTGVSAMIAMKQGEWKWKTAL